MPESAVTRLERVLDLEEKQGWRNRGVIGGLPAMGERWADAARSENIAAEVVDATVVLMAQYADASVADRPEVAGRIRSVIAGDADALAALQEPAVAPEPRTATPSEPDHVPEAVTIRPAEATDVARTRVRKNTGGKSRNPHDLQASPEILDGVGPARVAQLARLGIENVLDLIMHLPIRYDDYSQLRTIDQLQPGEQVTIIANLWEIRERKIGVNRVMVQGILADGTGTLHATWWNRFITKKLETGTTMRFSGKVGLYLGQKTLDNPVFEALDREMVSTGRLTPVYALTEGISNNWLRDRIRQALEDYAAFLSDPLPESLRTSYDLLDLENALLQVHMPDDQAQLDAARRRLIFEELFYLQLGIQQRRRLLKGATAPVLAADDGVMDRFKAALPFELTQAQVRVLDEITVDVHRSIPMTRLVQGDVGSGKTAVAAGAMYVALSNGMQSALLAPTQILAEQHHRGISELFGGLTRPDGSPVQVGLLTGRVVGPAREEVLNGLSDGSIDIIVGTTALIQDNVEFHSLAFSVVDEQHRFGVEQRGALRTKGDLQPHLLVMSATPIPRSLALTIFGELDISILDEMPPGRQAIQTKWFRPPERERLYRFLEREAEAGRQAFIVYPLVEESENVEAGAAVEAYDHLANNVFPKLRLALLHGRLSGSEKDAVMSAFAAGEYDALVSTSVIEVGIDVPNASLILIEDAERFGLAQLHQFRGRVGRGAHKSYCALISRAEGDVAEERLRALERTNNGFELAEKDLELRGPGDFLGTRQSGLPNLAVAQLSDLETLVMAREAAVQLFESDPELEQYPQLARQVERFWSGQGDIS